MFILTVALVLMTQLFWQFYKKRAATKRAAGQPTKGFALAMLAGWMLAFIVLNLIFEEAFGWRYGK